MIVEIVFVSISKTHQFLNSFSSNFLHFFRSFCVAFVGHCKKDQSHSYGFIFSKIKFLTFILILKLLIIKFLYLILY